MWRRLLRQVHPDAGGEHELFVWAQALREYVAGDAPEDSFARIGYEHRQPPPHPTRITAGRSPSSSAWLTSTESVSES